MRICYFFVRHILEITSVGNIRGTLLKFFKLKKTSTDDVESALLVFIVNTKFLKKVLSYYFKDRMILITKEKKLLNKIMASC